MRKLLRKDALLQESLRALIAHQRLQRRLQAQYDELAALDAGIINFCSGLSSLEQRLLQASNPDMLTLSTPVTSVSLAAAPARHHAFSLNSLLRMSESLGRMSFAPSFFIDQRQDAFNPAVCRPPAPLDKVIQHSLLHHEPAQLLAIIEEERATKQREAEAKAAQASTAAASTGAAASEDTAMSDVDSTAVHAPALGRQESAASTLPSFAELAAAGQSTSGALNTPHLQRQDSAQRHMGAVQPVALDLDLESSSEEDDD